MSSGGYTKLFESLLESTVWSAPDHVRIVWITMLAMADRDGRIEASIPGLAHRARVSIAQCEEAIACFLAADPYSRTKDHDGRRIEEIDGGWRLLNHLKYRERASVEHAREKARGRKQRQREREGQAVPKRDASRSVTDGAPDVTPERAQVTPCHPIAEAEADPPKPPGGSAPSPSAPTEPEPETEWSRWDATVRRGWKLRFAKHRSGAVAAFGPKSGEALGGIIETIAAQARIDSTPFDELASAVLDAYWADEWPRVRTNTPTLANLANHLDRLMASARVAKPNRKWHPVDGPPSDRALDWVWNEWVAAGAPMDRAWRPARKGTAA